MRTSYLATSVVLPQDGTTPLILAAASGHVDCVKELLEQGADPRTRRVVSTRVDLDPVQFTHCLRYLHELQHRDFGVQVPHMVWWQRIVVMVRVYA
jgi:hypothetical protein